MTDQTALHYQPDVQRVPQSKQQTKSYYDRIAGVYDLLAERSEQPMREAGLDRLNVQRGERVLEIGFGTGHCVVKLADAVGPAGRVYGIDLSDKMLALARQLTREHRLADRVELRCGDAEQMPYGEESMDALFMSFVLELFDTPAIPNVIAECKRVLKPSGRICVVGLSKAGKSGLMTQAFEWTHRHFPNLLDCRPIYIRRALEAAGLVVRDARIDHMWVPVEIVLAAKPNTGMQKT